MNRHLMKLLSFSCCLMILWGCNAPRLAIKKETAEHVSGEAFYKKVFAASLQERETLAKNEILSGNIPAFLKKFKKIKIDTTINNKILRMEIFVLPDYLSIGNNEDFTRIPLTPMTAQVIADSFHCFLPTRKIVDIIYQHAKVKLEPVPMYAYRDSAVTMYQHHLIIEGQRKLRKGLIAGIKKDVVITRRLKNNPGKVAIYGWHKMDGKPIQPLYTGHVNWYVDYSHGTRLIYEIIKVNGKKYFYTDILKDETLRKLICDEEDCSFYRY